MVAGVPTGEEHSRGRTARRSTAQLPTLLGGSPSPLWLQAWPDESSYRCGEHMHSTCTAHAQHMNGHCYTHMSVTALCGTCVWYWIVRLAVTRWPQLRW